MVITHPHCHTLPPIKMAVIKISWIFDPLDGNGGTGEFSFCTVKKL